jgi:hypothetical protein
MYVSVNYSEYDLAWDTGIVARSINLTQYRKVVRRCRGRWVEFMFKPDWVRFSCIFRISRRLFLHLLDNFRNHYLASRTQHTQHNTTYSTHNTTDTAHNTTQRNATQHTHHTQHARASTQTHTHTHTTHNTPHKITHHAIHHTLHHTTHHNTHCTQHNTQHSTHSFPDSSAPSRSWPAEINVWVCLHVTSKSV